MIQEGVTTPSPLQSLTSRNPVGWIVLALFFVLTIGNSLQNSTSQESPQNRRVHQKQETLIETAMRHKWFQLNTAREYNAPWNEQADPDFKDLDPEIGQMKRLATTDHDPMAAKLYAAMEFERGRSVDLTALAPLQTSNKAVDRDFWTIYASSALSPKLAERIADRLPDSPVVYKLAKVHALEKAGVKDAISLFRVNTRGSTIFGALLLAWAPVMLVCFFAARAHPARGIPMAGLTEAAADRLALHAAVILTCFLGVGIVAALFTLTGAWAQLASGGLFLIAVFLLQYVRFGGVKVSLSTLGLTTENLGKNIGLGFLGFFAELPIAMVLADVGAYVFRFLPSPTHPVSEALQATHRFSVVFPLVVFGSIIAPIWEELTFRGLLFPALNRFVGLIPSILISSLLFGLVHPQGPALVLSLGFVGVASCILSYRTKSLVPSIVMHCLHNSVVFALTIYLS